MATAFPILSWLPQVGFRAGRRISEFPNCLGYRPQVSWRSEGLFFAWGTGGGAGTVIYLGDFVICQCKQVSVLWPMNLSPVQ